MILIKRKWPVFTNEFQTCFFVPNLTSKTANKLQKAINDIKTRKIEKLDKLNLIEEAKKIVALFH